jgi:hypothetical protein
MTPLRDNSSRNLLITAIVLVTMQGANLVGVAVNRSDINHNNKLVTQINREYAPMMFLEGLAKNNNYQTQEIVSKTGELIATFSKDEKLADKYREDIVKINEKYLDFQKTMIDQMMSIKKATNSTTRGGYVNTKETK